MALLDDYLARVDAITALRTGFQKQAAPAIQVLLCDAEQEFLADKISLADVGSLHAYLRAHGYSINGTSRRDPRLAYTVSNGNGYMCFGIIDGLGARSCGVSEVIDLD